MNISSTIHKMERFGLCHRFDTVQATQSRSFTVDNFETLPAYHKHYLSINDSQVSSSTISAINIPLSTVQSVSDSKDVVDSTVLKTGVFTVVNTTGHVLATLPLYDLASSINGNKKFVCHFPNVDLSKSYLTFSTSLDIADRLILTFNLI